jgi:hypothetical protein
VYLDEETKMNGVFRSIFVLSAVVMLASVGYSQVAGSKDTPQKPDQVRLTGAARDFNFSTAFGGLRVRWQVASTDYFGKEPYYVVKESWDQAARSLSRRQFPAALRSSPFDWNLVFMDEAATVRAYPFGKRDCHPAWIRPPADIFVSAFYIGTACRQGVLPEQEARNRLRGTLYHEFGHAIEYQLLGDAIKGAERYHSEGFAEWFEVQALSDHGLNGYAREIQNGAKKHFSETWNPKAFSGSNEDYYRAYALIESIVKKRNLSGLLRVYAVMKEQAIPFDQAVKKEIGWSLAQWMKEASSLTSRF